MSIFLGIDIGGTKIAGGLVTGTGEVLRTLRRPTPLTGCEDILNAALSVARELITQADCSIAAIGIGTGGQVDCDRGMIISASEILPGWAGTLVKAVFEDTLGLPTYVDNDVNALAVGESRFGAGRGLATVLYLALGTGVGGALVLNGQVHHGAHWSGGETGSLLLTISPEARRAQSGEIGTLEAYASGPGLMQTWRELTGQPNSSWTGQQIAEEAQRDPQGAEAQAVAQTGEHLGYGLVSLANVLDPYLIVIGGGMASLGDMLLNPARRILQMRALPGPALCPVVPASLGPEAAVIGAACLGMTPPAPNNGGAGVPNPAVSAFAPRLSLPSEGRVVSLKRTGIGLPTPPLLGAGGRYPLTIALVPLDERPVNTRYPEMLGAIGGANILLPPEEIRGWLRHSADTEFVGNWLRETAKTASAAIVSCEFLGCGNLIASRISQDSAAEILARLCLLADINSHCPVHAFSLITRVANADDCVEEPEYWAQWGTKFHRYAQLTHQAERGELKDHDEMARLEETLPPHHKSDWLTRRMRNHTVSLGLLDMAAREQLASLRLTSDDTSPWGFPSRERDWLSGWLRLVGPDLSERVMMHPGADEVASALLSKLLMENAGRAPRIWPLYSMADDAVLVAPYEDRPVCETVEGQIRACGGILADSPGSADIILGIATPSPRRTDYHPEFLDQDRWDRLASYKNFLSSLAVWQAQGVPIALADVAYPNGSDPLLCELLLAEDSPLLPGSLCAYGAWNTAGNTLGGVIAQAACALLIGEDTDRAQAQNIFLAHRFLEDWGYQGIVRREARAEAQRLWGRREPRADDAAEQALLCAFVEGCLSALLVELQARGIGSGLKLTSGSVRLPWRRTFEVDFTLT